MPELHPCEDPRRRCLTVDLWPEGDRVAWERAMAPGDVLDGTVGPGFHWRDQTREKYRKGYGRWLTFLVMQGWLEPDVCAADRITPERVRLYCDELISQDVGSWTLWGRLAELLAALKAMAPEYDFNWLRKIVPRLEANTVDKRNKLERLQPADRLLDWAITRLDNLLEPPPMRDSHVAFRDALMVGLLSCCPVRLGNLSMIEIDNQLRRTEQGFLLRFTSDETKTSHPMTMPVAQSLTSYLDHYLDAVRPQFLITGKTERLWITRYGLPMRDNAMHAAITRTTERAFGKPINPHLFRDCAATFVALEDPEHVRLTAPLLGHIDPRATERHYIQANQIVAGRRIRASVAQLRSKLTPNSRTRP
ncbi:MAG: tyrosine-type recombinase/integrase [Pseudomonadota bacterium]